MASGEVLADPIRLAIARYLATNPDASATQVATAVAVHLNTARAHLAALQDAGVALRATDSGGRRGRPVVRYRLAEGWAPPGEDLLSLSKLLAAAVRSTSGGGRRLREAAREWGRRWSADETVPVERRLAAALTRLGFQVRADRRRLALSACPCPLVTPGDPALVCSIAEAVTNGVLDGSELTAGDHHHDPSLRRCSAALHATAKSRRRRRTQ